MRELGKTKKGLGSVAIILLILIAVTLLTWIVPAGEFARDESGMVVPGSYQRIASMPIGIWNLFLAVFDGFVSGAEIIFFIIFAGAYVHLLVKMEAFHASVGALLRKMGNRDILIVPLFFTLFSIAGATIGLGQATYALVPVFTTLCIALGFDRLVGSAIVLLGAGVGFASALTNPSTVVIASNIAGIPLMTTGFLTFRVITLMIFTAASAVYVTWYALRIRKDPSKSYEYGFETASEGALSREAIEKMDFTLKQKCSMLGFVGIMAAIIYGSIQFSWGMRELSALFLVAFVLTGALNCMGVDELTDIFSEAGKSMMEPIIIIALARSIS